MSGARVFGALVGVVALVVAGCVNYSGKGNEFVILATVDHVGEESITVEVIKVEEARGDASGWFDEGTHQIHDNCKCHGFWTSDKRYGTVYDASGAPMALAELRTGYVLRIEGAIRSHKQGKTHKDRPVFTRAQVVQR